MCLKPNRQVKSFLLVADALFRRTPLALVIMPSESRQ